MNDENGKDGVAEVDGGNARVIDEEGSKVQISSEEDYEDGSEEDDNDIDNSNQMNNQSSSALKMLRSGTKRRKKGKGARGKAKGSAKKNQQQQLMKTIQSAQDNVKLFNNLNEMANLEPARRNKSTNLEGALNANAAVRDDG